VRRRCRDQYSLGLETPVDDSMQHILGLVSLLIGPDLHSAPTYWASPTGFTPGSAPGPITSDLSPMSNDTYSLSKLLNSCPPKAYAKSRSFPLAEGPYTRSRGSNRRFMPPLITMKTGRRYWCALQHPVPLASATSASSNQAADKRRKPGAHCPSALSHLQRSC